MNYAQELMPYRFEAKPDTNMIKKDFASPWFEPKPLDLTMDTSANSAMWQAPIQQIFI
jgi:hypothetical protein